MRTVPLVLLGLCTPAAAWADDTTVDVHVDVEVHTHVNPAPEPDAGEPWLLRGSHWEGELAIEGAPMGGIDVADVGGGRVGVLAIVGRQLGPVRLGIDLSVARFSAQRDLYSADGWWDGWQDLAGESQRIGASLRYRVLTGRTGFVPGMPNGNLALYGELGAGREHVAFDGGGELTRHDVIAGVGVEIVGGSRGFGGLDLGVRVQASTTPEHGVPDCAAACRAAATDATHDLAVLVHLGALFGR